MSPAGSALGVGSGATTASHRHFGQAIGGVVLYGIKLAGYCYVSGHFAPTTKKGADLAGRGISPGKAAPLVGTAKLGANRYIRTSSVEVVEAPRRQYRD